MGTNPVCGMSRSARQNMNAAVHVTHIRAAIRDRRVEAGRTCGWGLRANLAQFILLAVASFFVGCMVGLERTVTPLAGSEQFHVGELDIAAFVVVLGFAKAI